MRHRLDFIRIPTLVLFILVSLTVPAQAQHTAAEQAILLDYETGQVLYEKNADQRMPTSSMSKVMTMYVVFEALKDGRMRLEDTLPVSEKAWRKGGSKMFVEAGERVEVEKLIKGVVVQSGNDATIVLAEGLAGSEDAFAVALNSEAEKLGMDDSHFVNASGWPHPEHYSTARDLAKLAIALIREYPQFYDYYSIKEFTYNDITQKNRNPLLYRNIDVDGIKTGHTEVAGYGLIASGERNGRRIVLVINGLDNERARAEESARLIEWGFRGFENLSLFQEGETVEQAPVLLGQDETVPLVADQEVKLTLPSSKKHKIEVSVHYKAPVPAPVEAGTQLATLRVSMPGMPNQEFPLYAGEPVNKLGLLTRTLAKARIFLLGAP